MQERVDGLLQEGRRAGIAGETKVALRAFDRLLFCQPNHAEALEMRAQVRRELSPAPKSLPLRALAWCRSLCAERNTGSAQVTIRSSPRERAVRIHLLVLRSTE